MTADFLLRVENLDAGYATPVIRSVSLDLKPGERLGLSGPNGSGKSTLLKAIVGQARQFGGRIERGNGIALSYLAQMHPDTTEMPVTGRDVIRVARVKDGDPPPAVARLLGHRLDRMSGGQRSLVKAWAALKTGADVVLLDEPTTSLDDEAVALLAEHIVAFPPSRAAIIVSHDLPFLERSCTRIETFKP